MTVDARALHAAAVVADTHNDLLMSVTARPPARWGEFFREEWMPQLVEGGVNLQVLPVFVDGPDRGEGALRETLRMVEAAYRLAEHNADAVALCRDGAEIDAALASGRIALVLALEGAVGVGENVELLETLGRLGVRVVSLAHFGRTALADGSGEDATGGRLTRDGLQAVALMERLGILLDISHLGAAGVEHVLDVATRPVIATHSAARSLRDHHRNLTDDQIRGVAAGGGVVCVNFFAPYLHETEHTLDRLVDHVAHMETLVGAAHVGIGPDFVLQVEMEVTPRWCDDFTVEGVDGRQCIPGLEGPRGLPLVTEALLRRGFTEEEVRGVVGGNVLRLFRAELGVAGKGPA
jgi:membrane dipeptidase